MKIHVFLQLIFYFFPLMTNLIVLGFSLHAYLESKKRSLFFIAISSLLGALVSVIPQILPPNDSLAFWYICELINTFSFVGWVVGFYLLVRDYVKRLSAELVDGKSL